MNILRPKTKEEIIKDWYPLTLRKAIKAVICGYFEYIQEIVNTKFKDEKLKSQILNEMTLTTVQKGNFKIFKYLIENGADMHCSYNSCLLISCEFGYYDIVNYILKNANKENIIRDVNIHESLKWTATTEIYYLIKNYLE